MIIAEPLSDSDAAAIARVREAWLSALNADDVDGMVAPLGDGSWRFARVIFNRNQPAA